MKIDWRFFSLKYRGDSRILPVLTYNQAQKAGFACNGLAIARSFARRYMLRRRRHIVITISTFITLLFSPISFSKECVEISGKRKPDGGVSVSLICQSSGKDTIDINNAAEMNRLKVEKPEVHIKVVRVLEVLRESSKINVENKIVAIGVEDVFMGRNLMYTSDPPKTNVSFIIGDILFGGKAFVDNGIFSLKQINVKGFDAN